MPVNGYSVGRDVSLDIVGPAGPVRFNVRTGWKCTQKTASIEVKRLDGIVDHLELPQGWGGSMDIERNGPSVDDYFADLEQRYYSGLDNKTITITETIREPGGGISQYRFTNVVLKLDDNGEWRGDATVKPKIAFTASRRIKV